MYILNNYNNIIFNLCGDELIFKSSDKNMLSVDISVQFIYLRLYLFYVDFNKEMSLVLLLKLNE